jgi:hypothetical protein
MSEPAIPAVTVKAKVRKAMEEMRYLMFPPIVPG